MKTLILTVLAVVLMVTVAFAVTYPDGSQVQTSPLFNDQCEVVHCEPSEMTAGTYVRYDPPGNQGYYEIYIYNNGKRMYRRMLPGDEYGQFSYDGINWTTMNFGE